MSDLAARFQEAIALVEAGRYGDAETHCAALLAEAPDDPPILFLRGLIAYHLGDAAGAIARVRDAIARDPENPSFHATLGAFLIEGGLGRDAVDVLERAVALQPDDIVSQRHLARQYALHGRVADSIGAWQRVTGLAGTNAGDLLALGQVLETAQEFDKALGAYRQAVMQAPDSAAARNHLGACLQKQGLLGDAIQAFEESMRLRPDDNPAVLGLLAAKQIACGWADFAEWNARADALTDRSVAAGTASVEDPFMHLTRCDNPGKNFAVAKLWSDALSARVAGWDVRFDYRSGDGSPLRVGYLSSDFHDHATAHLMAGLFAAHDRNNVSVHAYSCGPDDRSTYRRTIAGDCDSFTDLSGADGIGAARRINADGIDILVDLKGYTRHNRLEVAALRPAPLQVAWLGFPGTSGADFFDYVITDDIVTPPQMAAHFSEAFAVMPHSYQVTNDRQPAVRNNAARSDFGIAEDALVLASFNNTYKLEPVMFALWMEILLAVPNAVLWLLTNNDLAKSNLRRHAAAAGISDDRLLFAERLLREAHLQRLAVADLGLDTRIYNGHTTTSDALWAGLPVVTLCGAHFASRVSASLLTAFGMPELITHTLGDYRDMVVSLAQDTDKRAALRGAVARRRTTSPLFDTGRFARGLDLAYGEMWRRHRAEETPRRLVVAELTS